MVLRLFCFTFLSPDVNYPFWQVNENSCMYLVFSVTYTISMKHISFWGAKDKNRAVHITTPLINSVKAIVLAFKRTGKYIFSVTNTFFQWQMWCIQHSFHVKKKRGAFKHMEYNSQALLMDSNILKRKAGEKISFTCFGVKEKEQLYYPKSPLVLSVLLGAHFLSMWTDMPSVTTHCLWLGLCVQYGWYCFNR